MLKDMSAQNHSDSAEQNTGARIKADLNLAASKTFGESKGESLFDGIDEKSIELNLSLADSVISSNRRRGAYSAADLDNLPNLRGGLAAFYAAAESGDSKAANAAWKIAYTPAKQTEEMPVASRMSFSENAGTSNVNFQDNNLTKNQRELITSKEKTKTVKSEKNISGVRYAGEDKIRFYTDATHKSANVDLISLGDELVFLGEKKKTDDIVWAKVKYNGKTGWVNSEYLKTQKSAVKGDTFSYLTNELTDTDINAGLKVAEKDNEFYYDYTDVVMNQINTVLPEFDNQRVISYEDYVEKFTPKLFGKYYFGQPPAIDEYYASITNNLLFFYNQVNHGAPWDIKRDPSWKMQFGDIRMPYYDGTESNDERFLFRGELVTREDLGNITYGYLGSAMGLGEKTLYWGAGVANDWYEAIIEGKAYVYDKEKPYGDAPKDHDFVKKGIELYYEDYPEAKPGINRTIP